MNDQSRRPDDPWLVWWWKNLSTPVRLVIVFAVIAVVLYAFNRA
jgi:membrane protein insertase Oxa1/YidC/SpoIIIJ